MKSLKKVRSELKLTQKQMAKMLNTPLRTYIKWENGERRTPGIAFAMI
ncbi:MAG TPA: XRE family transcriptional regulator, partial [Desulfobacterales bacterium]|nr:XRE family transcriptional regulator [Desulfobacterales bacterium]